MSQEPEKSPQVIVAHQDLVRHIEQGAGKMRALSVLTLAVSVTFSILYASQIALPLTGLKSVTVDLTDPGNLLVEFIILALALVWLYVGLRDYRFSSRMMREIKRARMEEESVMSRMPKTPEDEPTEAR